MDRCLVWTSIC